MNFSLLFFFLFSLIFLDAGFLQFGNGSNDTVILDEFNKSSGGTFVSIKSGQYLDEVLLGAELSADTKLNGVGYEDDGGNVLFTGKDGPINLTMNNLAFGFCSTCRETFHICYDTYEPNSNLKGACPLSTQCELKIEGTRDSVKIGKAGGSIVTDQGEICDVVKIEGAKSKFQSVDTIINIPTCIPKIENGMIRLHVIKADSSCPVQVVNAKIKYPAVITTPLPSTSKPGSTSEAGIPLWLIIVLCILGVLLIVGLIILGVYFYKKRQNSKKTASPVEEPQQITVVTAEAKETVEPPSKTRPDLNFTKFEPGESRKSQKKAAAPKKEATKEPTTTEEFVPTPPPKVTESAPPDPSKPEPKLPQGYYPFIPRIIPKSYKSLKTDSVEETIKKNKVTPVETVVDSVRRNCLKESDSAVVKEMKQKYPEVSRPLLPCEIKLLCIPVSKMFAELNQMARESEENLTALGVQFDSVHRIVIMTCEGRKYLQDSKTPSTVVYFAFGAEFHEIVTDDMKVMPKLSMAHLFVIALQPRFEEYHRRKALTWLRRDLPKIRGNYSSDERKAMIFPINAIEKAFVLDSKYFLSLRGIDTDSEGDRKRMAEAKAKQKNENGGGKTGDLKGKKKKPTKKRD